MIENLHRLNDTEKQICEALEMVPDKVQNSNNSEWTTVVKDLVGHLGISLGWTICASGFDDEFEKEWLYDLVWYKNDSKDQLYDVALVLECEWDLNYSGIKYDFEKLLLSKSNYKVMVFQGDTASIQLTVSKMKSTIDQFKLRLPGERYLLLAWNNAEDEFEGSHIVPNEAARHA